MIRRQLFALLLLAGCQGPVAIEAGPFLPLHTAGAQILDASGRTVLLRGLQHHALQDVAYSGRAVDPEDYARIAQWGFSTLRVAISWSRIEPVRGQYDAQAIAEIVSVLDAAQAAGLTAIIEWHQDLFGQCASPLPNANGAPDWACRGTGSHFERFSLFWANDGGVFDAYLAAWAQVISAVDAHPALIGYDIMNEPAGVGGSPTFERDVLFAAYRRIITALRASGAHGLLFLDATVFRNDSPTMETEPLMGADLVFAPHLYSGWATQFLFRLSPGKDAMMRDFELAQAQATNMQMPVWNGEWGTNLLSSTGLGDMRMHVELEDQYAIGSSYWAFERAVPGQGDDSISGGQSLLDETGTVRRDVLDLISRPYPIQIPGVLSDLHYDFEARRLTFHVDASGSAAPLVIYAPERLLGGRVCVEVEGGRSEYGFGAQRVLIRLRQVLRYTITVKPCV